MGILKATFFFGFLACSLACPTALLKPILDGKIIGGNDALDGEVPYQVSLHYFGNHRCGGAIISDDWVITAAHCVYGSTPSYFDVKAGSVNVHKGSSHKVSYLAYHQNYDPYTMDWDIAVVKVQTPFVFSELIQPVAMPSEGEELQAGEIAVVSGWGYLTEGSGFIPDRLQRVTVSIFDRNECNEDYSLYGGITDRMVCAGESYGGKDACQGDSGGPLVIGGRLQGIVSWGAGCGRANRPGVYSKVSALRSFVTTETGV